MAGGHCSARSAALLQPLFLGVLFLAAASAAAPRAAPSTRPAPTFSNAAPNIIPSATPVPTQNVARFFLDVLLSSLDSLGSDFIGAACPVFRILPGWMVVKVKKSACCRLTQSCPMAAAIGARIANWHGPPPFGPASGSISPHFPFATCSSHWSRTWASRSTTRTRATSSGPAAPTSTFFWAVFKRLS